MTDLSSDVIIVVSTIVMIIFIVAIVRTELTSGKRARDFLAQNKGQIADLAQRTQERYRAVYGKNPTMEMPIYRDDEKPPGSPRK
jgi:hypothetical protein